MRFLQSFFVIVTIFSLSRVECVSLKKFKNLFTGAKNFILRKKPAISFKPPNKHTDASDLKDYLTGLKVPYDNNVELIQEIKSSLLTCLSYIPPQPGYGINVEAAAQEAGLGFVEDLIRLDEVYPSHYAELSEMLISSEQLEEEKGIQVRKSDTAVGTAYFVKSIKDAITSEACVKKLTRRSKFFKNLFHSRAKAMKIVHAIIESSLAIAFNKGPKGFVSSHVSNSLWQLGNVKETAFKRLIAVKTLPNLEKRLPIDVMTYFLYNPANFETLAQFRLDNQKLKTDYDTPSISVLMAKIYSIPKFAYNAITDIKYPEIGLVLQKAFGMAFESFLLGGQDFAQLSVPCDPSFAKGTDYYATIFRGPQGSISEDKLSPKALWDLLNSIKPAQCFTTSAYNRCLSTSRFNLFSRKPAADICAAITSNKDSIVRVSGKVVKDYMRQALNCEDEHCLRQIVPNASLSADKTIPNELREFISAVLKNFIENFTTI